MTTITIDRAVVEQALEALKDDQYRLVEVSPNQYEYKTDLAIAALEAALAQEQEMPSNTRYTVAVEGQALTYWDNIHDAVTNAQRAVYADVDATTRAIDDLRAGRLAEWSYGFSAVRIYPPQKRAALAQEQPNPPGCDHCNHPLYAATRCRVCGRVTEQAEPVEPVAWSGYDLDGMVEAFSRVIEAHYQRANPFQNPVDMDAQMALRILRGFIPTMKAYAAPPQRKPLTEEWVRSKCKETWVFETVMRWVRAVERAHGIGGQDGQV